MGQIVIAVDVVQWALSRILPSEPTMKVGMAGVPYISLPIVMILCPPVLMTEWVSACTSIRGVQMISGRADWLSTGLLPATRILIVPHRILSSTFTDHPADFRVAPTLLIVHQSELILPVFHRSGNISVPSRLSRTHRNVMNLMSAASAVLHISSDILTPPRANTDAPIMAAICLASRVQLGTSSMATLGATGIPTLALNPTVSDAIRDNVVGISRAAAGRHGPVVETRTIEGEVSRLIPILGDSMVDGVTPYRDTTHQNVLMRRTLSRHKCQLLAFDDHQFRSDSSTDTETFTSSENVVTISPFVLPPCDNHRWFVETSRAMSVLKSLFARTGRRILVVVGGADGSFLYHIMRPARKLIDEHCVNFNVGQSPVKLVKATRAFMYSSKPAWVAMDKINTSFEWEHIDILVFLHGTAVQRDRVVNQVATVTRTRALKVVVVL